MSKVMMLTGGAGGLGRHLVERFARAGHVVIATDLNESRLQETLRPYDPARVWGRKLDVRQPHAWDLLIADVLRRHGQLDVLVNNAAYLRPGYIHEVGVGDVDRHIDTNVKGVIFGSQAAARVMVARRSGHIINIGSLASLAPVPGLCLYSASKFAVRGFSLSIAAELRAHGVAVSVVLPDAVRTPMLDLQQPFEEASLVFSGDAPLEVEDVGALIEGHVLAKRPLEVSVPRSRGALARFASSFPELALLLDPLLRRRGAENQRAYIPSDP